MNDNEITKEEYEKLLREVKVLAESVEKLATIIDKYFANLLETVAGRVPDGCVPIKTHQEVVKGILVAFSIIVVVSVGAVKLIPHLLGIFQ